MATNLVRSNSDRARFDALKKAASNGQVRPERPISASADQPQQAREIPGFTRRSGANRR